MSARRRGFILLVDIETGRVWGEALRNIEKKPHWKPRSPTSARPAARPRSAAISWKTPSTRASRYLSVNAMEDPRFAARQSVQLTHLRSVCCVPLIAQGQAAGHHLHVDNRLKSGVFTERHLAMLSAFANQASVAIQNARLYDNLRGSLEERLRLQDALHKQETQRLALEEASRLKSDFIGFVAHELRNPLTTIRGYVQTILADEEQTLPEEVKQEFYEAIEADSDRLLDMINELLDVSRLEAGRPLSLALKPVDLRALLGKTRPGGTSSTNTLRPNTVSVSTLPTTCRMQNSLSRMRTNLIRCCPICSATPIKYSPEGGEIKTYARLEPNGDAPRVVIGVKDIGVGMTQEQCGRLFRRYERVERDDIKNIPGTGLGLYLVKSLVELHGGEISCESAPGAGSVFIIRLPLQPPAS